MISFFSDEKLRQNNLKYKSDIWDGFHSGNMRPSYNSIPLSTESSSSPYDSDVTLPILQANDERLQNERIRDENDIICRIKLKK